MQPKSPVMATTTVLGKDAVSVTIDVPYAEITSWLPAAPNLATLGSDQDAEVILYDALITADAGAKTEISIAERAYSGTSQNESGWPIGTPVSRCLTSYDWDAVKENIEAIGTSNSFIIAGDDVPPYVLALCDPELVVGDPPTADDVFAAAMVKRNAIVSGECIYTLIFIGSFTLTQTVVIPPYTNLDFSNAEIIYNPLTNIPLFTATGALVNGTQHNLTNNVQPIYYEYGRKICINTLKNATPIYAVDDYILLRSVADANQAELHRIIKHGYDITDTYIENYLESCAWETYLYGTPDFANAQTVSMQKHIQITGGIIHSALAKRDDGAPIIDLQYVGDVSISGLTISNVPCNAISIDSCVNVKIDSCQFTNCKGDTDGIGYAIQISGASNTVSIQNNVFSQCGMGLSVISGPVGSPMFCGIIGNMFCGNEETEYHVIIDSPLSLRINCDNNRFFGIGNGIWVKPYEFAARGNQFRLSGIAYDLTDTACERSSFINTKIDYAKYAVYAVNSVALRSVHIESMFVSQVRQSVIRIDCSLDPPAEWDKDTIYDAGVYVTHDGLMYRSLVGNNLNNEPVQMVHYAYWEELYTRLTAKGIIVSEDGNDSCLGDAPPAIYDLIYLNQVDSVSIADCALINSRGCGLSIQNCLAGTIAHNVILNSGVDAGALPVNTSGIYLDTVSNLIISGNKIGNDDGIELQEYGIYEKEGCADNLITNNLLANNHTAALLPAATTQANDNIGHVTESASTATVKTVKVAQDATESAVVMHGLSGPPDNIFITACTGWGNATRAWVTLSGDTGFVIHTDAAPTSDNMYFYWKAQRRN